jgi:glycosyltransferase involved in cell wall biosynthesis
VNAVPSKRATGLLVVADYPFVAVNDTIYAEIPWDAAFADLFRPAIDTVLVLGRYRRAREAPPGWQPVDTSRIRVLDAGDWQSVAGFVRNLPVLIRSLRSAWPTVGVLYLKLFYLTSLLVYGYNRLQGARRKPVATLLVGDAAEAVLLRNDLIPFAWARRLAAATVGWMISRVQRGADVAGFWARFLADKFAHPGTRTLIVTEPWIREGDIAVHDRRAARSPATILFAGRLIPRKRPAMVLEAAARLRGEGLDIRCVLVGEGPERGDLEARARAPDLAGYVTFTGWLGLLSPRMLQGYDEADIFCLPSFAEGLPLVIIEAMARGAAVVATAVSGTPEAVVHERTGLLVARDDQEGLTRALRRLVRDDALWRRCVEGGYEVARVHTYERQRAVLADAIVRLLP